MTTPGLWNSNADFDKRSLLRFLGRRMRWTLGDRSPILGFLKLTRRCNLDCPYCPWHVRATDFSEELDTDSWKRTVSTVVEMGARILVLEGGEPTLRSDLAELLDHCHNLGAKTILATNGTSKPWNFSPTAFTVSVDGPREVHEQARGKNTFDHVMRTLTHKEIAPVVTITVLTKHNAPFVEEMMEEIQPFVNGFLFTFLYPYKESSSESLTIGEIANVKRRLLRLKADFPILNPSKYLKAPAGTHPCHDYITVSVNHRGEIRQGCFVDHVEPHVCETCELSCYQGLSSFHDFNFEAWFNLYRLLLRKV